VKDVGEPCAGEPHARFDGGWEETRPVGLTQPHSPGASRLPDHAPRQASPELLELVAFMGLGDVLPE
jgi:hypothetical protein